MIFFNEAHSELVEAPRFVDPGDSQRRPLEIRMLVVIRDKFKDRIVIPCSDLQHFSAPSAQHTQRKSLTQSYKKAVG
jgi:hypothetical protein